ncbi:hypothetical protein PC116_g14994 [Phytophthora cactorum]|nr:hypothetical protein PC120_g12180 [Phytophthora cactorum]KAG4236929.1 hypothetical protein PC116_g14994 [Phytophthora cactorum]
MQLVPTTGRCIWLLVPTNSYGGDAVGRDPPVIVIKLDRRSLCLRLGNRLRAEVGPTFAIGCKPY